MQDGRRRARPHAPRPALVRMSVTELGVDELAGDVQFDVVSGLNVEDRVTL